MQRVCAANRLRGELSQALDARADAEDHVRSLESQLFADKTALAKEQQALSAAQRQIETAEVRVT